MVTLDDPEGGDWARAALEQIRFEREHPGRRWTRTRADEDEELDAGDEDRDAGDGDVAEEPDGGGAGDDGRRGRADETTPCRDSVGARTTAGASAAGELRPAPEPASGADRRPRPGARSTTAYEDFLQRFEQESGGEAPSP